MTNFDERQFWNDRYHAGHGQTHTADPFLAWAYETFVHNAIPMPGHALDLASGLGRHTIWLAERGWTVTAVDISDAAIAKARAQTEAFKNRIHFENQPIENFLESGLTFDLIVVFHFLDRALFSKITRAIRPGGFLIYKTYTVAQRNFGTGPRSPEHLLNYGELARAFPELRTFHSAEIEKQTATAELVAMKPTATPS